MLGETSFVHIDKMSDLVELLGFFVPAISIGFVIFITSINLYIKIRRKYPIAVNCWFCNQNTRVPYAQWNSWHCPNCEQYNGFTEDGDYNCDIPAQRQSKLNRSHNNSAASIGNGDAYRDYGTSMPHTNGLCDPCNRNQELKMQQLASFTPVNECDFDEEVEEFRQRLEQSYRLCLRCERHLKRTLTRVKRNVLGSKLAQIGSKGLRALDSHVVAIARITSNQKRQTVVKICLGTVFLLSIIGLYRTGKHAHITKTKLDTIFSPLGTSIILMAMSHMAAAKIIAVNFVGNLARLPYISSCVQMLNAFGTTAYLFVTADIMDYVKNNALNSIDGILKEYDDFGPQREASAIKSSADDAAILNLSGCMLSTVVICMQGAKFGPILSLLLWSLNTALPSALQKSAGLQIELIVDFTKILIMLSIVLIGIRNLFKENTATESAGSQQNNSFHRIADYQSDVSDDSEAETELNTSQQSVFSNRSMYSKRSTNLFNKSLNLSNASTSPSIFSSISKNHFTTSSNMALNNHTSHHELNRTFTKSDSLDSPWETSTLRNGMPTNHLFNSQQSLVSDFTSISQRPHDISHRRSDPNQLIRSAFASSPVSINQETLSPNATLDSSFTSRCPSRNSCYDVPDDFQSGITQLSINRRRHRLEHAKSLNTSLFVRNEPSSGKIRQRHHLLQPPKLNYMDNQPRIVAAHHASWVAGGYWNQGTSPQKRHSAGPHTSIFGQAKANVFPIISRTSSHSSGFESQNSSLKNGHGNDSNENSISDEIERESIVSEPAYFSQPAQRVNEWQMRNGAMLASQNEYDDAADCLNKPPSQPMSQPIFSTNGEASSATLLRPQSTFTIGCNRPKNSMLNSATDAYEASTFSPLPLASSSMHHQRNTPSSFNFNKFDRNLPTFKPGSLLRLNLSNIIETSTTDC